MEKRIQIREEFRRDGLAFNFLVGEKFMAAVARAFPGAILQVGYPAVCREEQEVCRRILFELKDTDVEPALAGHALLEHVDLMGDLLRPYPNASANIWIPVSDYLINRTLNRKPSEVLDRAIELIQYWQKNFAPNQIDVALADATEKEAGLASRVALFSKKLHEAGARSVVICDTKGQADPEQLMQIFKSIADVDSGQLEFHPHNDNGLGVENVRVAIESGVSVIGTALFNSGERFTMIDPRTLISHGFPVASNNLVLNQIESLYQNEMGFTPVEIKNKFSHHTFITGTQYRLFDRIWPAKLLFGVTSDKYILAKLMNINEDQINSSILEKLKNTLYKNRLPYLGKKELQEVYAAILSDL